MNSILEEIADHAAAIFNLEADYLFQSKWTRTYQNPGGTELWKKIQPDGVCVMLSRVMAIEFQQMEDAAE